MTLLRKYALLVVLLIGALACSLTAVPATATPAPPASPTAGSTDTPAFTATVAATDTQVPTGTASPSDTPDALLQGMPAPFTNLMGIGQFFNPVGQPAQAWNGVPIMPEATAGQEFKPGAVYGFKATAAIAQGVSFYKSKMPPLGFSLYTDTITGSTGSGSNAMHNSVLYFLKGSQILLIYIASYDTDTGHISVVLSTQ